MIKEGSHPKPKNEKRKEGYSASVASAALESPCGSEGGGAPRLWDIGPAERECF